MNTSTKERMQTMTNELGTTIDEIKYKERKRKDALMALERIYREPYHSKSFYDYSEIYNFLLEA